MGQIGADVDGLEKLALLFTQSGRHFAQVTVAVDRTLAATWWKGPDADGFTAQWRARDRRALARVGHQLTGLGRDLRTQAHQQRVASEGEPGVVLPRVFTPISRSDGFGPTGDGFGPRDVEWPKDGETGWLIPFPLPKPPVPPIVIPRQTGEGYGYEMQLNVYPSLGGEPVSGEKVFEWWMANLPMMFPIPGMPANPQVGQQISLSGNPVEVVAVGPRSFTLRSLPGHAEGPDNYITFEISEDGKSLRITTSGPSDRGVLGEQVVPAALWNALAAQIQAGRMVAPGV